MKQRRQFRQIVLWIFTPENSSENIQLHNNKLRAIDTTLTPVSGWVKAFFWTIVALVTALFIAKLH